MDCGSSEINIEQDFKRIYYDSSGDDIASGDLISAPIDMINSSHAKKGQLPSNSKVRYL